MLTRVQRTSTLTPEWRPWRGKSRFRSRDVRKELPRATAEREKNPALHAQDRLKKLLAEVKISEEEMLKHIFSDLPREQLLTVVFQASGLVTITSLGVAAFCGVELFGRSGMMHSPLLHFLYGVGAALPLIAVDFWTSSEFVPSFIRAYSVRSSAFQVDIVYNNFSRNDALLVIALLTLSECVFVYPCLVGCLATSAQTFSSNLNGTEELGPAFESALLFISAVAGMITYGSIRIHEEAKEAIVEAVHNADRYYNLTMPSDLGPKSAKQYSEAFKQMSQQVLKDNQLASAFGALWTFAQTFYGGMIWKTTGDLSVTLCLFLWVALFDVLRTKSQTQ